MTTDTLPCISESLQLAIRAYGLSNGWKNAAKALAYGPVFEEPTCVPAINEHVARSKRLPPAYAPLAKLAKGYKRNKLGGLVCPKPGGMEREWGDLMGTGTYHGMGVRGVTKPGHKPNPFGPPNSWPRE